MRGTNNNGLGTGRTGHHVGQLPLTLQIARAFQIGRHQPPWTKTA
jgi:hypothetical protein